MTADAPRFGLVARTRLWTVALVGLALSAAVLTHQALGRLQNGLQQVVANELDHLMDSVRLVQQSEALISQSLSLAQSQSQEERRRQWVDLVDSLEWVRKMTRQVASHGHTDPDLLTRLEGTQGRLAAGVEEVDTLVRQRLRLREQGLARGTAAMAQLEERIAQTAMRNRGTGAELSVLMGYFSADTRSRMRDRVDQLSAEVGRQQNLLWGLTGLMVVLMLVLVTYLHRTVVRRVVDLQRAVSQDPVDEQGLAVPGHDEIARLAHTVRNYVERIQANERQLQRANQDLTYLAEHDPLTRLANRRHFDAASRRMLVAVKSPLAVAVLDIDLFKQVNDRFGHDFGDQALVHVAQSLGAALRDRDVLARFGGEEFVVLMPVSGLEAALEVCERMRQNVAQQPIFHSPQEPVPLTVSVGVALITGLPLAADDVRAASLMQQAFQAADVALYKAKAAGRNRVCATDEPVQVPDLPLP
ncbi:GGDEF domain-containing protein [Hydrogenophaga soli]